MMQRLLRFGVVGVVAALVHLAVFAGVVYGFAVRPLVGNVLAFLCAFGVSYRGQSGWTFADRAAGRWGVARYFLTACVGFLINETVLWCGLHGGLSPMVAVVVAIAVAAATTYVISHFWVFDEAKYD